MRNFYESVNRKRRAEQHRRDAEECYKAGFQGFADVNWEMANMLDPYVEEDMDEVTRLR